MKLQKLTVIALATVSLSLTQPIATQAKTVDATDHAVTTQVVKGKLIVTNNTKKTIHAKRGVFRLQQITSKKIGYKYMPKSAQNFTLKPQQKISFKQPGNGAFLNQIRLVDQQEKTLDWLPDIKTSSFD